MVTRTRRYAPEFWVHACFYVPMVLCYAGALIEHDLVVIALIFQLLVGFFQVICGIIHALADNSIIHTKYLLSLLGLFFFWLFLVFVLKTLHLTASTGLTNVFGLLFLIIIPVGIATWYLNMVSWYYGKGTKSIAVAAGQEDILDDLPLS